MPLNEVLFTISGQDFTLGQLIIIPTVLILGYLGIRWLARVITVRLAARQMQPDIVHLIRRIFYIVALVVLAITTLDLLNVPLTAFAFISGAIAIGVGFGAQNIINNFISGWILMWERPIRIGDFLEVGDAYGTVESIHTRSTLIRRTDGVHLLIPNSALLENTVVNWTLIDDLARTKIRVGVAYGSPVKRVAELIRQATEEQEATLDDPAPVVLFEDFGDNSLVFDVFFWINAVGERDLRAIRSDIRFRISELFETNNIVVAFPQRDVHLDGSLTLLDQPAK
jgi:small-conductance mechanosensitive channel